jgi:hypothetical protein
LQHALAFAFFFCMLFHLPLRCLPLRCLPLHCCRASQISTHIFEWICLEANLKIIMKKITYFFYICCKPI